MKTTSIIGICIVWFLFGCSVKGLRLDQDRFIDTINAQGEQGETSLIKSVKSNNIQLVQLVLQHGADPGIADDSGKTAFQYAFESDRIDMFKMLLEYGNPSQSDLQPKTQQQHQMIRFLHEKQLYEQLRSKKQYQPIQLFDRYFSEYPNGVYRSEVERLFKDVLQEDFNFLKQSASRSRLKRFIDTYLGMGNRAYQIVLDRVNVRSSIGSDTSISGTYFKKDRVYAYEIRDGQIRTSLGWIHQNAVKRIQIEIPVIGPYIKESQNILKQLVKSGSIKADSSGKGIKKSNDFQNQSQRSAKQELETIRQNPTLSDLEEYILKYQSDPAYGHLVKYARELYKRLLFQD